MTNKKTKRRKDKRLFIWLPSGLASRKISLAGIREVVAKKLSISPTSMGFYKLARSGFTLSPRNKDIREALL